MYLAGHASYLAPLFQSKAISDFIIVERDHAGIFYLDHSADSCEESSDVSFVFYNHSDGDNYQVTKHNYKCGTGKEKKADLKSITYFYNNLKSIKEEKIETDYDIDHTNRFTIHQFQGGKLTTVIRGFCKACYEKDTDKERRLKNVNSKTYLFINKLDNDINSLISCFHGQVKPVIKKSAYPNSLFNRNEDNRAAAETVELKNGDKLTINHSGCDYFQMTFRFETKRFQADTTDIRYWIGKGIQMISEIKGGLDSPMDIHGGEIALKEYLIKKKTPFLGDFIGYGDYPYNKLVTFDRVQKLSDKRFAFELTYASGNFKLEKRD